MITKENLLIHVKIGEETFRDIDNYCSNWQVAIGNYWTRLSSTLCYISIYLLSNSLKIHEENSKEINI